MERNFLVSLAFMFCLAGCATDKPAKKTYFSDGTSYSATVKALNEVVKFNNFSPIVASRNYTYANIAAYQCVAAGDPQQYRTLSGQLNGFSFVDTAFYFKDIDYNFAALLAYCQVGESVTFPEGSIKDFVDSLKTLAKDDGMPGAMYDASLRFADTVAAVIINWSKSDNYLQSRSAPKYTVKKEPGRWIPTAPGYTSALEPSWNTIRPLVMDSADQFMPPRPIPYNMTDKNGPYYKQVIAIKNSIDSLTDQQKHIADFWDDLPGKLNVIGHAQYITKKFSPPGHWMSIVGIAAQKAKADFAKTVAAYTLTSICMFDAFIVAWDEKFRSNMVRPETVINELIDQDWRPHLQTPPFPEYIAGHTTVSAASAEALTKMFGDNFAYIDTTELEFGVANRSFKSFRQAANENIWARYYGGIHYFPTCVESEIIGKKVGDYIVGKLKIEN